MNNSLCTSKVPQAGTVREYFNVRGYDDPHFCDWLGWDNNKGFQYKS